MTLTMNSRRLRALRVDRNWPQLVVLWAAWAWCCQSEFVCASPTTSSNTSVGRIALKVLSRMRTLIRYSSSFLVPYRWDFLVQRRKETKRAATWLTKLHRLYWFLGIDIALHLILIFMRRWLRSDALIRLFYRRVVPYFSDSRLASRRQVAKPFDDEA